MFWSADRIIEATGGELVGQPFSASTVNTDSRSTGEGELFIALLGESFDGHGFAKKAYEQGASAALVSYIPEDSPKDFPFILVEDTLEALQEMARYRREHTDAKIIGITGSVGKTSAKEMLKLALSKYGETYATSGNYNNHIGLPITLCNMPEKCDYAIIEMGMNHTGEISFLSAIARPQVALITNVAAVHLEFFDSVEDIAYAKAEIFDGMDGGIAVLPADNEYAELLTSQAKQKKIDKIITFGEGGGATLQLLDDKISYNFQNEARSLILSTIGTHWPKAALGVLACVAALNLSLKKAEAALKLYREQAGRGAVNRRTWKTGEITLMDDAYNASPISMIAAIETLSQLDGTRTFAILGDMLELGTQSAKMHAALADPILEHEIDAVVTIGKEMKMLANELPAYPHVAHFDSVEDAISSIGSLVKDGDAVLCKGSHGSGIYKLVDAIKSGLTH